MIPIFLVFMLTPLADGAGKYVAFAVFVLASFTDFLEDIAFSGSFGGQFDHIDR